MRYNITFIDDCARHCMCAQMKEKSEANVKLRQYIIFIEKQFGYIAKRIRLDKGGEYLTNEFRNWCAEKGIALETTAPYSPSQNGVAERFNRTLVELFRAMLIAHNLPKTLWPEALNYAAYIRNQSYTRALEGKTPKEVWTKHRPNVAHLHEFGIPVWVIDERENRTKLEPKSIKQIFVGFEDGPKAIKYYDTHTHRVKTSRNYSFVKTPLQSQGEQKGEKETIPIADVQNDKKRKHPHDDSEITPRRSNRPRTQHDYNLLNDPYVIFHPAPELAALACDPDEGQPISTSDQIINYAFKATDDPMTLKEAKESPDWPEWEKAIQAELNQLRQKGTWVLTEPPDGRVPIKNKWIFVKKYDRQGNLDKYKARLVAKGYSQIPGIDYIDVFSPVVRLETIRALLALAAMEDWEITQLDVKGAYLNGHLKEEIYMTQPDGYEDGSDKACRLIKTLYGLKQSGRKWNTELNIQLSKRGYQRAQTDPCVYIQHIGKELILITVWVDDMLLFATSVQTMQIAKRDITDNFEVTDLGEPKKIVGIEITRDRKQKKITITQTKYIETILAKYGLQDANPVRTPLDPNVKLEPGDSEPQGRSNNYASLIGSLMYAAVATRPDIAFAVNQLASFTANPTMCHWTAAKRVLRYLKGTKDIGITYSQSGSEDSSSQNRIVGYNDASFADNYDRTSVSGYAFVAAKGAITWGSKKQNDVALSSTEAEYVCLSDGAREANWLRHLYQEIGFPEEKATLIYEDNQSALAIAENPCYHKRTKHFDIKHHYIRDQVQKGVITLQYLPTAQMTADILTKALPRQTHELHMRSLGMTSA
jgi:transposase InsO family protein